MSRLPLRHRGLLLGTAATVAVAIPVAVVTSAPGSVIAAIVAAPLMALAIWLTRKYWTGIDEAAREAQKSAWLWGGSGGLGVGYSLCVPQIAVKWVPQDISADERMMLGATVVMLCGGLGFLITWAAWWLGKR